MKSLLIIGNIGHHMIQRKTLAWLLILTFVIASAFGGVGTIYVYADDTVVNIDCRDDLTYSYEIESKTLTITGKGEMHLYDYEGDDWSVFLGKYRDVVEAVVINNGVSSIDDQAFMDWKALRNITISDSVKKIGNEAFDGCSSLKSVTIPVGVTEIGYDTGAFMGCTSLSSINVSSKNKHYSSKEGVLFDYKKRRLVAYPPGKKSSLYIVPKSVECIEPYAFYGCANLKKLSFSLLKKLDYIGDYAFTNCVSLKKFVIPKKLELPDNNTDTRIFLGSYMLSGCTSLKSAVIYGEAIPISAFAGCKRLESVKYGGADWSEYNIDREAFSDCTSLKNIKLPHRISNIETRAFTGCTSLKHINMPAFYVTKMGKDVFNGCTKLKSMTIGKYQGAIKNTSIGKGTKLTVLKKSGYTFKGWYTKKTGGKRVTKKTRVAVAKKATLYAQFKKK
jgi:uncharacterized repeat protein (TIGR02543 family)